MDCEILPVNTDEILFGSIKVWPNPSPGIINIDIQGINSDPKIQVYDLVGIAVPFSQDSNEITLQTNSTGLHFVELIFDNGKSHVEKVMIH